MTSLDKDGVTVRACGDQAQSQRKSAPSVTISKVGREAREKVFITQEHNKPYRLGRESPIGGAIYDLPSTLNPLPRIAFAKGNRSEIFGKPTDDPADIPTNDALQILPDSQTYKYRRQHSVLIGTEPKFILKDAELIKAHHAAFIGRESPGPSFYGEDYQGTNSHGPNGPNFNVTRPRMAPARKFGIKTKMKPDWQEASSLPVEVGPARYPRTDVAIGHQYLSGRRNQSVHEFPRGPKFAKVRSADTICKLDAARSSFGQQSLGKNKSEPSINFNCDTRKTRDRSMVCRTQQDLGPVAAMPKMSLHHPVLPKEAMILKSGIG